MIKNQTEKQLISEISNPPLQGVFWIHSISTMIFFIAPVLCSEGGVVICYYQLPKYCLISLFLLIAPFVNAFVFSRKITFRKKFALHHITMITYLTILVISVVVSIRKFYDTIDAVISISPESYTLPVTFFVNWAIIFWREHVELENKKIDRCNLNR